jgi:hypothetical protein
LAKRYKVADTDEKVRRYEMPQNAVTVSTKMLARSFLKQFSLKIQEVPKDYVEVDERERRPGNENRKWEEEQLAAALIKYGARDKKASADEYDLLLDDRIDFAKALRIPGQNEVRAARTLRLYARYNCTERSSRSQRT